MSDCKRSFEIHGECPDCGEKVGQRKGITMFGAIYACPHCLWCEVDLDRQDDAVSDWVKRNTQDNYE